MSQSTIGELESKGSGSRKTAQIAARCGVRVKWLAEGVGPMLSETAPLSPEVAHIASAVDALQGKPRENLLSMVRYYLEMSQSAARPQEKADPADTTEEPNIPERRKHSS